MHKFMSNKIIDGKIIDGKAFAENLRGKIKLEVERLKADSGKVAGLAVVLVGQDPASQVYVRNKAKQTAEVGMNSFEYIMPQTTTEAELLAKVVELNNRPEVHGILVQLPLPKHISEEKIINAIAPEKDVDGFHVVNAGKLATGQDGLFPCTPVGSILLLKDKLAEQNTSLKGKHAVVIGRSNIVGKPMAQLLIRESATVTICHSATKNIEELCAQADIIIAAVGKPNLVKSNWVKAGAIIIDVGINRIDLGEGKTKLIGDVDFDDVLPKISAITPVPGGVGPMTIACLLRNSLKAFSAIEGLETKI
jgi:methylenetetrahydrofolate dehydrogenase (NADP+) / methenyltetrahydrofolate cyclohydrolase